MFLKQVQLKLYARIIKSEKIAVLSSFNMRCVIRDAPITFYTSEESVGKPFIQNLDATEIL